MGFRAAEDGAPSPASERIAAPKPCADGQYVGLVATPAGEKSFGSSAVSVPAHGAFGTAALVAGPPVRSKSFAQVACPSINTPDLPIAVHPPALTDSGEPPTFFSLEEIKVSCSSLNFAIIAKTLLGVPHFKLLDFIWHKDLSFTKISLLVHWMAVIF